MKGKIFGVLIALCMVCVFVGCDDPSSEKPGVNYKDSGFVGTWVCLEVNTTYGVVMKYTYSLDSTGKGLWTGRVVYGEAEPYDDFTVEWEVLSDTEARLEETFQNNNSTSMASLFEGGTKLRAGGRVYEKLNENPDPIYIESGFVGTWVYEESDKPKYIYVLNEEGKGLWAQFELTPMEAVEEAMTVLWEPLADGKVELTETLIENPVMVRYGQGSLSDNNTKLTVDSLVYTKQ